MIADARGFYLGTLRVNADGSVEPGTRESREFWSSPQEAALALETGQWTQRASPDEEEAPSDVLRRGVQVH